MKLVQKLIIAEIVAALALVAALSIGQTAIFQVPTTLPAGSTITVQVAQTPAVAQSPTPNPPVVSPAQPGSTPNAPAPAPTSTPPVGTVPGAAITLTNPGGASATICPLEGLFVNCHASSFTPEQLLTAQSISWNFGDGTAQYNSLKGFNAVHAYAAAGNYTITLTITLAT